MQSLHTQANSTNNIEDNADLDYLLDYICSKYESSNNSFDLNSIYQPKLRHTTSLSQQPNLNQNHSQSQKYFNTSKQLTSHQILKTNDSPISINSLIDNEEPEIISGSQLFNIVKENSNFKSYIVQFLNYGIRISNILKSVLKLYKLNKNSELVNKKQSKNQKQDFFSVFLSQFTRFPSHSKQTSSKSQISQFISQKQIQFLLFPSQTKKYLLIQTLSDQIGQKQTQAGSRLKLAELQKSMNALSKAHSSGLPVAQSLQTVWQQLTSVCNL